MPDMHRSEYREYFHMLRLSIFQGDAKDITLKKIAHLIMKNEELLSRVKKDYYDTIRMLSNMIDASDPYTHGHSGKVMRHAMLICSELGIDGKERAAVKIASLLHDIGKVFIDKHILFKKGKLTKLEWEGVMEHPVTGARIISQLGFLYKTVPIVYHHHERFGGGGYPDPRKREKSIPIGSRIITVCDAFDAMTSDRPYRKAMPRQTAIKELKTMTGVQFDPAIVEIFVEIVINGNGKPA